MPSSANFPVDLEFGDEFQGLAYGRSLGCWEKTVLQNDLLRSAIRQTHWQ